MPLWWDAGTLADLAAWKRERLDQHPRTDAAFVASRRPGRAAGKPLSRHTLRKRFRTACKALGAARMETLTIHHGRHTFISHALAGGRTLAEVRDAAGHATYGTAGQLQQRPAPAGGAMFRREWFDIVPVRPAGYLRRVRYWDLAAAVEGDYTCGVLMSRDTQGFFYVEEILRGQWSPAERDEVIFQTAKIDGYAVEIMLEQEPGSAGKSVTDWLQRNLAGYAVRPDRPTGAKDVRAQPFAAQCEARNVKLVAGLWNREYLEELCIFPYGAYDDQVDASTGAFTRICRYPTFSAPEQPERPPENLFSKHKIPMGTPSGSWRQFLPRR